ncbi:MAG TPA: carboxypeptidase-like regulatory domain-containing protein [Gemmatimonadaceae bacterium]|jgi:hypothetical protein
MIRSIITACLTVATIIACASNRAAAQTIHGTVRDSASHDPIAGAVLLLLDESSHTLVRGLTNVQGEYRLPAAPTVRRLKVLRIGFRPRDIALPASAGGDVTFDVAMAALPTLLEPIHVTSGAKCSARDDRLTALSLLDQARAALLGSVVARDDRPATEMLRLRFTKFIDERSGRPTRMRVVADSTTEPRVSFEAPHSASEFVTSGFVSDDHGVPTFEGPDAETLLDDGFRDGYCFELRDPDSSRPNQVGLGFTAASSHDGRVDIDGTLWVDTLARQIEEIRFDYRGLPGNESVVHAGGSVHFRQLANGTILIDRWFLRLPTAKPETTYHFGGPTITTSIGIQEAGGVIAAARWPDGFRWEAPLDTVHVQLSGDARTALAGRRVTLAETPYHGVSDANGTIVFPRMLAGPYMGTLVDSTLVKIGIVFPTSFKFSVGDGEAKNVPVQLPSVAQYVISRCGGEKKPVPVATDLLVIGRIADPLNEPMSEVAWRVLEPTGDSRPPVSTDIASSLVGRNADARIPVATGETKADGVFAYCGGSLAAGQSLRIDARAPNRTTWHTTEIPVDKSLIVASIEAESSKLLGVFDNDDGQWIAGATIRDTLGNEAQTSRIGVTPLTDLTPIAGYYMLEVRKSGYSPRFLRVRDDTTSEILAALAPNPLGGTLLPTTVVSADRKLATDAGLREGFVYRCGTGLISCVGRSVLDKQTTGNLDNFVDHVDGIVRDCQHAEMRSELAGTQAGGAPPSVHAGATAAAGSCPILMHALGGNGLGSACTPNYVVNGFEWALLGGNAQSDLDQYLSSATIDGMEIYLPGHPVPKRFDPKPFSDCGVIVIWTR